MVQARRGGRPAGRPGGRAVAAAHGESRETALRSDRSAPLSGVIKTQDNYCGQIPKAAINFATKKGLPCFFKGLEKAAVQLMVNEGKMTVVEQAKEL